MNLFFPDATAAVIRLTFTGNWIHIEIDDLKLIGVYFLGVVQVLVVTSDHLELYYWLVINLDAAVLLLIAFEDFILGGEGFWELVQISLAIRSTHKAREDAIREL